MKIGYLMQKGVDVRRRPYDGPANHVVHVIRSLEQLGHSVRLIARLDEQIWVSDNLETFEPVEVRQIDRGLLRQIERLVRKVQSVFHLPYFAFFDSLRFAMACRQELDGVDLLYERKSWMSYGGVLAARWSGIPHVMEDNGDSLADLEAKGEAPQGLQRRIALAIMKRTMHSTSHIAATGDGWRDACIKRWGLDESRVTTVENGTELLDLLDRDELRSFHSPDPDHLVTLAYVGGFYPWHGVAILLNAFARVLDQGLQARLLMVGSGSGMGEAQSLAETLELRNAVTFTGQLPLDALASLLADADIGLSPYCGWPEFSGLKILDYKAAGTATIASGENGRPSTVSHAISGLITPPCDEDALVEAMQRLVSDPDLQGELGRNARLEAEQNHGWIHTAQSLERIFTGLVGDKPHLQSGSAHLGTLGS